MIQELVDMLRPSFPVLALMTYKGIEHSGYTIEVICEYDHDQNKLIQSGEVVTPEGKTHLI